MTRQREPFAVTSPSLGAELRRFWRLCGAMISLGLDRTFELSRRGAKRRRLQALLFAAACILVGLGLHVALDRQTGAIQAILASPMLWGPHAAWIAVRMLLVLGIAALLALHLAGAFVADIFDLKDARVAWRFISRLAGGAAPQVLHLREGQLADGDRTSPIIQIGGPARVVTEYDTAALFEKPDGAPHVVGPTGQAKRNDRGAAGALLDGFERLREPVISLRDQYIGNPSGEPLTVVGRSLDGIPISVTDVRGVFSVRREAPDSEPKASAQQAYRLRTRDVESLIYNQTVDVLSSGEHASGLPRDWTASMHALIREALQEFMGQHKLTEFLAGVGKHEADQAEYRTDTILSKTMEVSSEAPGILPAAADAGPRFRPRTELSAKFRKYGSEFSTRAQELGLELHWIGVGTWKIPDEQNEQTVTAKHIEAWRMNRENTSRLESDALDNVATNALVDHKLRLLQDVPLASHSRSRARYSDKVVLMECLLQDFREQMGDALDIYYRAGIPSPDLEELEDAVSRLEQVLRISQGGLVGNGATGSRVRKREDWDKTREGPPAPSTRAEAIQYRALLSKLNGDYRVAEAMLANEKRRHSELSREQLIARIVERFERHGR